MKRLDHYWYSQNPVAWLLWPLSLIYRLLAGLRRNLYRRGVLSVYRAPKPVIVVGNISVGGTGKTPLIIHLCQWLARQGLRAGVISRGYGGNAAAYPMAVNAKSDPFEAGDEPVLIAMRTDSPVVVGPRRDQDVDMLLHEQDVDLILADDGMQHYRLGRDAELAVIDGRRGFGNGFCLPAGPLREPVSRLETVDLQLVNGGDMQTSSFTMHAQQLVPMFGDGCACAVQDLTGQRVHAVAGIGHPQRFFDMLREQGIDCIEHTFSDHHRFHRDELLYDDELPVLMTEKDAVKCSGFNLPRHYYVPIDIELSASAQQAIEAIIKRVCNG
jgi:tetraacyldisaccharide 4'-kinase